MIILARILLCISCIISVSVLAAEKQVQKPAQVSPTAPPVQSPAPAPAAPLFDTLESTYVQFDIPSESYNNFSILKSLGRMVQLAQQKYYSLLTWKTFSRRAQDLQIPHYNRKIDFGTWVNDPGDDTCYNTRALVLMRDSDKEVTFNENNKCNVMTGTWKDDYTGQTFTKREDIQIDHVVPLKNAYISGAFKWGFKARCLYANYLGYDYHLKSVNGGENMKKGDKSPERYMPPNPDYACKYIHHWLTIKFLWNLKMTESEASGISQLLKDNKCNLATFRVSDHEILNQTKFANDNMELCTNVDPSATN